MGILIISSLSFFSFRFVFEERDEIWGRVNGTHLCTSIVNCLLCRERASMATFVDFFLLSTRSLKENLNSSRGFFMEDLMHKALVFVFFFFLGWRACRT